MQDFIAERLLHNGLTYEAYRDQWQRTMQQPLTGLDRIVRKYVYYSRYNWERAARVEAAYTMSNILQEAVSQVTKPQHWMVLTEDWCVDSAYSLPIMAAAAGSSPLIRFRILPRDNHLGIMDQYLTRGGRSIPKLVAFEEDGRELFMWGPRPEEAHRLRETHKASGVSGAQLSAALEPWYEDGNWQHVDTELAAALSTSITSTHEMNLDACPA